MSVIAEFNDEKGFNVKLTEDKIYISAVGHEETIALRSISGIGLYDDIEKFNKEKEKSSSPKVLGGVLIGFGAVILFGALSSGDAPSSIIVEALAFVVVGILVFNGMIKTKQPTLDTYLTLMISGNSRKFKFDKSGNRADQVADFINKVEDTLTAYKQN